MKEIQDRERHIDLNKSQRDKTENDTEEEKDTEIQRKTLRCRERYIETEKTPRKKKKQR